MFSLTPELQKIDLMSESESIQVRTEHFEARFHAIFRLVESALYKGENSVLVIREEDVYMVKNIILNLSYNNYILEITNDKISEKDWYRIKTLAKLKESPAHKQNFQISSYKYKKAKTKLSKSIQLANIPLFGGKTYAGLKHISERASTAFSPQYVNSRIDNSLFDFDQKEFWKIKEAIEEAVVLYEKEFVYISDINMISEPTCISLIDNNDIKSVIEMLDISLEKTAKLLENYYSFATNYREQENSIIEKNFLQINLLIDQLVDKINFELISEPNTLIQKSKFYFKSSKKNLKTFEHDFFELIKICKTNGFLTPTQLNNYESTTVNLEAFLSQLGKLELDVSEKYDVRIAYISSKFKRLNSQNSSSESPIELSRDLDILLEDLNNFQLWKDVFENNSLSVYEQIVYLENLHTTILKTSSFLNNNANYIYYKAFISQQSEKVLALINALYKLPKQQWINAYISWYLVEVLKKFTFNPKAHSDNMTLYKECRDDYNQLLINNRDNDWIAKQVRAFDDLKNKNKKLFNDITKKTKATNNSFNDITRYSNNFLKSLFPITVIYYNEINSRFTNYSSWDNCFFTHDSFESKLEQKFGLYFGAYEESVTCIDYNYSFDYNFNSLSDSRQLSPAKDLATRLLSFVGSRLHLYINSNNYIISTISEEKFVEIRKTFEFNDLQVYNNSGNPIDNLTDIIISDNIERNFYLVLENGLLDSSNIEFIDYQLELIDYFVQARFLSIDFSSIERNNNNNNIIISNSKLVDEIH